MRSDGVIPFVAGQVQIGKVQRLGRLERHGFGERALEVLPLVEDVVLVAVAVGQTVERTGQIMISFHFRWRWRAPSGTGTTVVVVVVVSRAINKRGATIAAVHINARGTHTHTLGPKSSTFHDLLLHLVRYCSCHLPTTVYLYAMLFFLETRPKPNGPVKRRVQCPAGM